MLKFNINFYSIFNTIPKTGVYGEYSFFNTDSVEKNFNNLDISYKFNQYGYRCDEFSTKGKTNILILGCSIAFGVGIPKSFRFGEVFSKEFEDSVIWNLSWPGVSGDYVSRIALVSIPILKPDICLINFPLFARREYFDLNGSKFDYRPDRKPNNLISKNIINNFLNLSSDYEDYYNFYKNYNIIENLCKINQCKFLFSIGQVDTKKHNINFQQFAGAFEKIDIARDGGHPGILSNEKHAKKFYKKYQELYNL